MLGNRTLTSYLIIIRDLTFRCQLEEYSVFYRDWEWLMGQMTLDSKQVKMILELLKKDKSMILSWGMWNTMKQLIYIKESKWTATKFSEEVSGCNKSSRHTHRFTTIEWVWTSVNQIILTGAIVVGTIGVMNDRWQIECTIKVIFRSKLMADHGF